MIIFLLVLLIILSSSSFANTTIIPADVRSHWANKEITSMIKDNIVNGYDDGTFLPDKEVTIAEFLKIFVLKNNYKLTKEGTEWPDWYVNTAIQNKLITKDQFNDYSAIIKRIDCINILKNYLNLSNIQKSKTKFEDIKGKSKDDILKITSLGIMEGFEDGTFRENSSVTRAQACKIILNAYNEKIRQDVMSTYTPNHDNSNIGTFESGDIITNRFSINKNRIFINDSGRYGNFNNLTINQEYINDLDIIKLINSLVDDNSYTYVSYIQDKYTINKLNVCYCQKEEYANNGNYSFQVRFYENGKYNVKESTGNESFLEDAKLCISLYKMWDFPSEYDDIYSSSERNLLKLEKAIGVLISEKYKAEFIGYIKEKIIEAKLRPNDEFNAKILEVKKIDKFTINTICTKDQRIDFYIS